MKRHVTIGALALISLVGCSSPAAEAETPQQALERRAHQLDVLAADRQDSAAWELYSQRCQAKIGDLESYSAMLDLFFAGRTPNYESATATVDGSYGQVVSVDSDPSAPPTSGDPRTWTLIDGDWVFDNC